MQVSDEAKLIAVRNKLIEAETRLYEANKIFAYIFEGDGIGRESDGNDNSCELSDPSDPVTGLYPGQKPGLPDVDEAEETECLD